jgi:FkbM family methyltransferase
MRRAKNVIALEPNQQDFDLLLTNLRANRCHNVVPLNIGVASKAGTNQITYQDRTHPFKVEKLTAVLQRQHITRVDFIKLDIEGYEIEVIENSIEIIKQTRLIAI